MEGKALFSGILEFERSCRASGIKSFIQYSLIINQGEFWYLVLLGFGVECSLHSKEELFVSTRRGCTRLTKPCDVSLLSACNYFDLLQILESTEITNGGAFFLVDFEAPVVSLFKEPTTSVHKLHYRHNNSWKLELDREDYYFDYGRSAEIMLGSIAV